MRVLHGFVEICFIYFYATLSLVVISWDSHTLVSLGFAVVASRFIGLYEQSNRHQLITVIQELDFEDE